MTTLIVFIFGTIIGSFLNVCIYRLPKGESIVAPSSRCPICKRRIAWFDNIPLVSYVLLGRRCRSCSGRISPRYFAIESMTGLLFLALYFAFGLGPKFASSAMFVSALIVIAFIDLELEAIPSEITITGVAVGCIAAMFAPEIICESSRRMALFQSLIGALVGAGIVLAIIIVWRVTRKEDAMGMGDVELMAMIGAFLGWKLALLTFFAAPFFGLPHGIVQMLSKKGRTIPYGPYLSAAAVFALLFGNKIIGYVFKGM